jgi:hypothetical protein
MEVHRPVHPGSGLLHRILDLAELERKLPFRRPRADQHQQSRTDNKDSRPLKMKQQGPAQCHSGQFFGVPAAELSITVRDSNTSAGIGRHQFALTMQPT